MRLKLVLSAFALLLCVSTLTSFVGYHYLALASEYRERNFRHLSETYRLIELLETSRSVSQADVAVARAHVNVTQAQAAWCLDVLSGFERWLFSQLGAAPALDICMLDLEAGEGAIAALDELQRAYDNTGLPPVTAFALTTELKLHAQSKLEYSLAFNPYVGVIEDRLQQMVRIGTVSTALGLALAFAFIGRDLVRSHEMLKGQTTALKKQTKEYSELAAVVERANDSIIIADVQGRVTWVNPSFIKLTGYTLEETAGKKPGAFLQGPDTDPQTVKQLGDALGLLRPAKANIINYTKGGDPYWVSLSISALFDDDGEHTGFVAISSDISLEMHQRAEIEAANKEIEHKSLHDPLTDLPNRRALDTAMEKRIAKGQSTTLVRIDLDHFKYVNDTMGHEAGDYVLQQVAVILREETRQNDLPARVGGDEFVVLLSSEQTTSKGEALAQRLLDRIREPMTFRGKVIRVGGSFGVASTRDGLLQSGEILVGADAALYKTKENGRNGVMVYTPDLHAEIADRREMARELKRAIAEEEFTPFFQPQVDARTRELIGVETLARWKSSALGMVAPDEFLPVAERLSIVEEIDDIIFRKALAQMGELQEEGLGVRKIALNVTAARVRDPKVVDVVRRAQTGRLKIAFEILETVLVEDQSDDFKAGIDELREAGVSIEIDDFGSGHASIVGLMQLQPDAMKIDKRLVGKIDQSSVNLEAIKSIINIAQSMSLTVIAEGVETEQQATILADLGCHVLQGYAFARPMPLNDFRRFLASRSEGLSQKA